MCYTGYSTAGSTVDSAVGFPVGFPVDSAVGSAVDFAVDSTLESNVDFTIDITLNSAVALQQEPQVEVSTARLPYVAPVWCFSVGLQY